MTPSTASPRRAHRRIATTTLAAAALALTACATDTGAGPAASPAPAGGPATTTVTTIAGNTVSLPGSKPAALFFFAVGCGECTGGAKSLAQAATTVGDKAEFLAVDMDPSETSDAITGFLRSIDSPHLPAAIDKGAALSRTYHVSALSTLIVIDPTGKVTFRATDPAPDKIQDALATASVK